MRPEDYINFIDATVESADQSKEQYWHGAVTSLLETPFFGREAYLRAVIEISIERGYEGVLNLIFDHYNVPGDLNIKQRLAYYQLLGDKHEPC